VLPVHVFGRPCAVDELTRLCEERGLIMIEDACEAIGAEYRGRKVGTFGKAAVFAFYANKQMTMGEGGIVTTDDPDMAALLRSLRNHGRQETGTRLCHERLGYNYRVDEMSAALGLSQLRRIEALLARRAAAAARYTELLSPLPNVALPGAAPPTMKLSWFVFVVRLGAGIDRDRVIKALHQRRVPSRIYFPAIHLQPFYRERFGFTEGDFPVAERVAASTSPCNGPSISRPGDVAMQSAAEHQLRDVDAIPTCRAEPDRRTPCTRIEAGTPADLRRNAARRDRQRHMLEVAIARTGQCGTDGPRC
jgi:perosamine synthetase